MYPALGGTVRLWVPNLPSYTLQQHKAASLQAPSPTAASSPQSHSAPPLRLDREKSLFEERRRSDGIPCCSFLRGSRLSRWRFALFDGPLRIEIPK